MAEQEVIEGGYEFDEDEQDGLLEEDDDRTKVVELSDPYDEED